MSFLPRKCTRRMPPVSYGWAKPLSIRSPRRLISALAVRVSGRRRLAHTAACVPARRSACARPPRRNPRTPVCCGIPCPPPPVPRRLRSPSSPARPPPRARRLPCHPRQAYDYVAQIESRYQTAPARLILQDVGCWVYLTPGVSMQNRAPCIGERGYSQTRDFSGALERRAHRQCARILVRRLHAPDFWYDHVLWPKPSGIRRKPLEHHEGSSAFLRDGKRNPQRRPVSFQRDQRAGAEISIRRPRLRPTLEF